MTHAMPMVTALPKLAELVAGMKSGEELHLTKAGESVAVDTKPSATSWPCQPGTASDRSFWMAPDFDAPLEDFVEHME